MFSQWLSVGWGMPGTEFPATPSRLSGAPPQARSFSEFSSIPPLWCLWVSLQQELRFSLILDIRPGISSRSPGRFAGNALCHGTFPTCPAVKNAQRPEGHPQTHSDAGYTLLMSIMLPTLAVTL